MVRELLVLLVIAGCNASKAPPVVDNPASGEEVPAFRVDVAPPARCAVKAPCEARLVLTALDGFKVNEEYPFKFVPDAGAGVVVDGGGRFVRDGDQTGTLTIEFRADAAGTAKVSGTFKLSVCTKEVCKIEAPKVSFDVPVT